MYQRATWTIVVALFLFTGSAQAEEPPDAGSKDVTEGDKRTLDQKLQKKLQKTLSDTESKKDVAEGDGSDEMEDSGSKKASQQFRDHTWGDTQDAVISSEGEPDKKTDTESGITVGYKDETISGVEVNVFFLFDKNDTLRMGKYQVVDNHKNNDKYVTDYRTINELLVDKYGNPNAQNTRVRDNNEFTDPGTELLAGELAFFDKWKFPKRDLVLSHYIHLSDGKIAHGIVYYDPDYYQKKNKEKEKEEKEKL